MTMLPKAYMRVARQLTGYWGTYLPSQRLTAGTIGRLENGLFLPEGLLSQAHGFNASKHQVSEQNADEPAILWSSQGVRLGRFAAAAEAPVAQAKLRIRADFEGANQIVIMCEGVGYRSFANLGLVKDLMIRLREQGEWDDDQCMVTEVVTAKATWIGFSTGSNQSAEFGGSADVSIPGLSIAALNALRIEPNVEAVLKDQRLQAFASSLPAGGTPLFMAMQFNKNWWSGSGKMDYLRSGGARFVEPEFGQ